MIPPKRYRDRTDPRPEVAIWRRLPSVPATPLGAAQQARIAARLSALRTARSHRWRWLAAATVAAAVIALAVGVGSIARSPSARRVALLGPGVVELIADDHVALRDGRLAVNADGASVRVDAGDAQVVAAPGALIEIEVQESQVTVAVYRGQATVGWSEGEALVHVTEGTACNRSGKVPFDRTRAVEIERALARSVASRTLTAVPASSPPSSRGDALSSLGPTTSTKEIAAPPPISARSAGGVVAPGRSMLAKAPSVTPRSAAPPTVVDAPGTVQSAPSSPIAPGPIPPITAPGADPTDPMLLDEPAPEPPPESELAVESRMLGAAFRRMGAHDAGGALALLDEYRARFPHGSLAPEAAMVRVDALVDLGRRRDALALLDLLPLTGHGRDRERIVLRGELRAEAGRCDDAADDFSHALDQNDPISERALYGRASCRVRRGDGAGARADLERYLQRFPAGRFSVAARHELSK